MPEEEDRLHPRRIPRQTRGVQRVATITDAAEEIFAEVGYAAATTNLIAARAGVPIGSLYQFFPSKAALLHAVAERYLAGFSAHYDALQATPPGDLRGQAAQLIDAMVIYGTEHKAFTQLILAPSGDPDVAAAAATLFQHLVARLDALLVAAHPGLNLERRRLIARAGTTAVKALLAAAIVEGAQNHERGMALIAEAQRLLTSYLEAAVAAHGENDAAIA
jgi:AcrR family transcriptional regulator